MKSESMENDLPRMHMLKQSGVAVLIFNKVELVRRHKDDYYILIKKPIK
jgi:hypothetical protein